MESFLNDRRIQQGEDWNLDILLSQSSEEYVPFIIGLRENPHFVVTVASTKYEKNNRYVESFWLPIDTNITPMFKQTVIEDLGDLATDPDMPLGDQPLDCLYSYTLTSETPRVKHYIYFTEVEGGTPEAHKDTYECRIRMNLTSNPLILSRFNDSGTSNWGSQNYLYQITLVSGQKMIDTILAARLEYEELDWSSIRFPELMDGETIDDYKERIQDYIENENNMQMLFSFIKQRKPNYFQTDIDWDSPLGRIWVPQSILEPTKLQVDTNLRKII